MYAMISGPAGPRDWSRQVNCFHPRRARSALGRCRRAGGLQDAEPRRLCPRHAPFFAANDFYEIETGRRIELFGNIAHVLSAYAARTGRGDEKPERRGINSIQLFKDPERGWRIVSMIWDNEREGVRVPRSSG